jgi:hypothetical protein
MYILNALWISTYIVDNETVTGEEDNFVFLYFVAFGLDEIVEI